MYIKQFSDPRVFSSIFGRKVQISLYFGLYKILLNSNLVSKFISYQSLQNELFYPLIPLIIQKYPHILRDWKLGKSVSQALGRHTEDSKSYLHGRRNRGQRGHMSEKLFLCMGMALFNTIYPPQTAECSCLVTNQYRSRLKGTKWWQSEQTPHNHPSCCVKWLYCRPKSSRYASVAPI